MNEENRQRVGNYISRCDSSPLYFDDYESTNEEFDSNKYTVEQMVIRALELTINYASYETVDDDYQCSSGRMRSSLDIWRHIKFYYPDVDIFEVIKALYKISQTGDYYGHYCTDISRRVFKKEHSPKGDYFQRNMRVYCSKDIDEYGMKWEDWEDI